MMYRNRVRPHTQDQADAWAHELDEYLFNGKTGRIKNGRDALIVAAELDKWLRAYNFVDTKIINSMEVSK